MHFARRNNSVSLCFQSASTFAAIVCLGASKPHSTHSTNDPTPALVALKSKYDALGPKLLDSLGEASGVKVDLSGLLSKAGSQPGWRPNYNAGGLNTAALRAGGHYALADGLEKSGGLSVKAAEKGLEALEKVLASGLTDPTLLAEANAAGIEASKAGLQALAELPTSAWSAGNLTPRSKGYYSTPQYSANRAFSYSG